MASTTFLGSALALSTLAVVAFFFGDFVGFRVRGDGGKVQVPLVVLVEGNVTLD